MTSSRDFIADVTVVCGFHLYLMVSKTSSTLVQSAAPSLVNTLVSEWTASGRKRKNTDKRNIIIPEVDREKSEVVAIRACDLTLRSRI